MHFTFLISIFLMCSYPLAAVAGSSATVSPSLNKAATRNFKMIKGHIDFGSLTPEKTVRDTFSFQLEGGERVDLRLMLRAGCLLGAATTHELKYRLAVSHDKGAQLVKEIQNGVIPPKDYQIRGSLCEVYNGEQPTFTFTMTLDKDEIANAPPDTYTSTLTFEAISF